MIRPSLFPKRKLVEERVFSKMEDSLLFFIFYYQKHQYDQFLAARELKSRKWGFHTKFMCWFVRIELLKQSNESERGNYKFFDFDSKCWCQKKKVDFTFDYKYLENEV